MLHVLRYTVNGYVPCIMLTGPSIGNDACMLHAMRHMHIIRVMIAVGVAGASTYGMDSHPTIDRWIDSGIAPPSIPVFDLAARSIHHRAWDDAVVIAAWRADMHRLGVTTEPESSSSAIRAWTGWAFTAYATRTAQQAHRLAVSNGPYDRLFVTYTTAAATQCRGFSPEQTHLVEMYDEALESWPQRHPDHWPILDIDGDGLVTLGEFYAGCQGVTWGYAWGLSQRVRALPRPRPDLVATVTSIIGEVPMRALRTDPVRCWYAWEHGMSALPEHILRQADLDGNGRTTPDEIAACASDADQLGAEDP
jgi:hypothetical protein